MRSPGRSGVVLLLVACLWAAPSDARRRSSKTRPKPPATAPTTEEPDAEAASDGAPAAEGGVGASAPSSSLAPEKAAIERSATTSAPGLTLEQAVEITLQRAPQLEGARKRVEARQFATLSPWTRFIPRLRLETGAEQRQDPLAGPFYSFFQPDASVLSQALNAGMSLRSELPVGTRLELGVGQRVAWYSSLVEALNPRLEPTLRLEVTQPLWRGMRPSVLLAPVDEAEARIDVEQANQLALVNQLALQAALAWIDTARATEIVALRKRSLSLASELEEVTQKLITGGELSQLDLALAQQTVSQRRLELVQAEREATFAHDALASVLAGEPGHSIPVSGLESVAVPVVTEDAALPLALDSSPALLRIEAQQRELAARATAEEDDVWPDIQVGVRGQVLGVSGQSTCVGGYLKDGITPCGVHPVYRGGYDQALVNMATGRFYEVGVTLSGEIPTWPGPPGADARATRTDIAALSFDKRAEELRLRHLVHRLVRVTEADRQTLSSSEKALTLSEAALEAQDTKLRAGRSTTFDLVRAQELLILSELQTIEARARVARSSVELKVALGAFLPRSSDNGAAPATSDPAAP